jgi:hypothetical protein
MKYAQTAAFADTPPKDNSAAVKVHNKQNRFLRGNFQKKNKGCTHNLRYREAKYVM